MDQNKIQAFAMANAAKFDSFQLQTITDKLKDMPDDKYMMLAATELRDPTMMLLISIFAGGLGIDRFMLGQTGLGVAKLLTCGGFGIWAFIDWFLIMGETRKYNYNKALLATM